MTQETINKRLEVLEKAITYLTYVVIGYALIVAGLAIYNGWVSSNSIVN